VHAADDSSAKNNQAKKFGISMIKNNKWAAHLFRTLACLIEFLEMFTSIFIGKVSLSSFSWL
jgi:hypothetical protein